MILSVEVSMRFFSVDGSVPAVLYDDGRAFLWRSDKTWGEIKVRPLFTEPRTDEIDEEEFSRRSILSGADLSKLPDN